MSKTNLLAIVLLCTASITFQQTSAQNTKANATSANKTIAKSTVTNKSTGTTTSSTKSITTKSGTNKPTTGMTTTHKLATTSTKKSIGTTTSTKKSIGTTTNSNKSIATTTPTKKTISPSSNTNKDIVTTNAEAKPQINQSGTTRPQTITTTASKSSLTSVAVKPKSSGLKASSLQNIPSNETIAKLEESSANTAMTLLKEKQAVTIGVRESNFPYSPKVIDVTEQTIRLGGGKKEELMFGFAAGDKIIFNFEEADSKELKEIEIIEYPTLSRFSDYKTSRVKNKEIMVNQQAVFIFRLKNSSLAKRICKLKIQRIPASAASENFNSSVSWITKQDTVWNSYTEDVIIGYDTNYIPRTKRVMVRSEIEEQIISDNIQRISSQQNAENRAGIVLSLPVNNRSPYKISRVVSWAYWIGVGEEGNRAWQQNVRSVRAKNMDYYTPLGAYSHGSLPYLALPKSGQQINYFIADQNNRDLFMQKQPFRFIDDGKGYGNYRKFTTADQCQGLYYLCVENTNLLGFADVHVKVTALVEKSYFEDQAYEEMVVTPVTEKQIKQQPFIRNTNLPITGM